MFKTKFEKKYTAKRTPSRKEVRYASGWYISNSCCGYDYTVEGSLVINKLR